LIWQCHLILQEVSFFEEGEPKIDGEPGDLKVCFFPCWFKSPWELIDVTNFFLEKNYAMSSFGFGQHHMTASEEKATTCMQQLQSPWYCPSLVPITVYITKHWLCGEN